VCRLLQALVTVWFNVVGAKQSLTMVTAVSPMLKATGQFALEQSISAAFRPIRIWAYGYWGAQPSAAAV
jgi:hypothetical protein